jgi:hypothetical protein
MNLDISQFQVGIVTKKLKENNILFMRALSTGDYEPCVMVMLSFNDVVTYPDIEQYERDIRSEFYSCTNDQRISKIIMRVSKISLPY